MIKAINNVSSTSFKGNKVKKEEKAQKTPEQIKNGKKKLAIGLAAAATVAIAGIAIASKVKSGKPVDLSDIKFDKGIAKQGDKLFTGTVQHTNKAGSNFELEYKKGKLISSTKTPTNKDLGNFIKEYKYNKDGTLKQITKTTEGLDGYWEKTTSAFDRAANKLKDGTEQKIHKMVQNVETSCDKPITKLSLVSKNDNATMTLLYDGKDKSKIISPEIIKPLEMPLDEESKSRVLENITKTAKELLDESNQLYGIK